MAAASPTNVDGNTELPPIEELRAKPIKKICIILLSFIPAVALLSITNVILAHIFVATVVLFPPTANKAARSSPPPEPIIPKKKKKMVPTKIVETKTVYVPPTQEDLDRIRQELESSDPLPPIISTENDNDNQRSAARVQSGITSMESLLIQRDEELDVATNEIDELSEAFASFIVRLEQDTSRRDGVSIDDETIKQVEVRLTSLRSLLGRTTFMDLDREDVMKIFMLAMKDLQWLLGADEPSPDALKTALFLNANNSLLTTLMNEATSQVNVENSTCQTSYLALDEGKPSIEFTPPKHVPKSPKVKNATPATPAAATVPPAITEETARESDLYELVENVKHILSRRDLASVKLDENNESMPSPIGDEGVEDVRAKIFPVLYAIEKKWNSMIDQEGQIRKAWVGRTEALVASGANLGDGGGGGGLCAYPELVEGMVARGLETLRSKGDLSSSFKRAAAEAFAEDLEMLDILNAQMKRIHVPEIDYTSSDRGSSQPSTSSWKLGKKSISYVVDSPLLHRGVVGWIDYVVDTISGYNDHLDSLLDYIVGDEGGSSVGTSMADAISKIVRKIPFPVEYVGRFKKAGILAGRTRILLEE
mmetsp:Transcript_13562/g.29489  ORF Transcript_13562/g.29489 Transcript_13562/m.29489 type:complete len:595 (+) Transcript_13562:34-1818(+)